MLSQEIVEIEIAIHMHYKLKYNIKNLEHIWSMSNIVTMFK